MRYKKKILPALIVLLIVSQFFRVNKSVPATDPADHFIQIYQPPEAIRSILKRACFDCHSYETKWPWYSNIAPVSWLLGHHVNEGRSYFNFSTWRKLSEKKRRHILEEMADEVEKGEMPIKGYTLMHKEARLSDSERGQLVQWFESL